MAERLRSSILSGMDSADAWNEVSVDLVRCAKVNLAHIFYNEETKRARNCYFVWCSVEEKLDTSIAGCALCDGMRQG